MKKWLCLLLAGVLLLSMTACKKSAASDVIANTESTDRQTTESTTENTQSTQSTESVENTQNQTTDHSYTLKDSPNEPGTKLLIITDNSTKETIQTLRLGACEWFIPEPIYTDITFDGNKDVLVPSQRTASGAFFAGFVWDGMAYVYTLGLENIPNIALDGENGLILSQRTQSQITSYGMYRFNTEKWLFEIVRSLSREPGDGGVTVVERDDSEAEINRFSATTADGLLPDKTDANMAPYYEAGSLWDLDSDKWRNWVYTP